MHHPNKRILSKIEELALERYKKKHIHTETKQDIIKPRNIPPVCPAYPMKKRLLSRADELALERYKKHKGSGEIKQDNLKTSISFVSSKSSASSAISLPSPPPIIYYDHLALVNQIRNGNYYNKGQVTVFYGPCGTGKSFILKNILLEKGYTIQEYDYTLDFTESPKVNQSLFQDMFMNACSKKNTMIILDYFTLDYGFLSYIKNNMSRYPVCIWIIMDKFPRVFYKQDNIQLVEFPAPSQYGLQKMLSSYNCNIPQHVRTSILNQAKNFYQIQICMNEWMETQKNNDILPMNKLAAESPDVFIYDVFKYLTLFFTHCTKYNLYTLHDNQPDNLEQLIYLNYISDSSDINVLYQWSSILSNISHLFWEQEYNDYNIIYFYMSILYKLYTIPKYNARMSFALYQKTSQHKLKYDKKTFGIM